MKELYTAPKADGFIAARARIFDPVTTRVRRGLPTPRLIRITR